MPGVVEMIGLRFNRYTVLERVATPLGGDQGAWYLARCDCGTEKVVYGAKLRSGHTKSCGCLKMERVTAWRRLDLTGDRFGDLVAVERSGTNWLCRCDCGGQSILSAAALRSGNTNSCGCRRSRSASAKAFDLTGNRFGRILVTARTTSNKSNKAMWNCICDCGTERVLCGIDLVVGDVKSCGCLRREVTTARWVEFRVSGKAVDAPHMEAALRQVRTGTDDCILWTGRLTNLGYGSNKAYRRVWLVVRGALVKDITLDHMCRTRACVNPRHLDPITQSENTDRKVIAQRAIKAGLDLDAPGWLAFWRSPINRKGAPLWNN